MIFMETKVCQNGKELMGITTGRVKDIEPIKPISFNPAKAKAYCPDCKSAKIQVWKSRICPKMREKDEKRTPCLLMGLTQDLFSYNPKCQHNDYCC